MEMMAKKNTAILNQASEGRGEYVASCRFLSNPKVSFQKLADGAIRHTSSLVEGKDVLVLSDTTELNYQHHFNYFDPGDGDLGPTGNDKDIGFFLHPGYVVECRGGIGLGFSYVDIWNRRFGKQDKHRRGYPRLPIQEKESYRWVECGLKSKEALQKAKHVTVVADREGDIFDAFAQVPGGNTDLLVRSRSDRRLHGTADKLYKELGGAPCAGEFNLKVKGSAGRTAREAAMEVRCLKVKLKRPENAVDKSLPPYVEAYAVKAEEQVGSAPDGEPPINWVLLTTLPANDFEQAMGIIGKYKHRWEIELLFGAIKSKGLNLELSQLETGKSLKALCVFAMISALRIMQLRQARESGSRTEARAAFTAKELALMAVLVKKHEGATAKQKNPWEEGSMAWAAWLIARLGGWKGYQRGSPPGFKTFTIGLVRFDQIYQGYSLML